MVMIINDDDDDNAQQNVHYQKWINLIALIADNS